MQHYIAVLKKYATFSGRSSRAEYWYFVLFNFIFSIVISIISSVIGDSAGILGWLYTLALIIPGIAVSARRLHDIGKSGWMQLIVLIPLIGWIWFIVLVAKKGDPADNKYGSAVSSSQPVQSNPV